MPRTQDPTLSTGSSKPPQRPIVLGIETSCDDTACALVDGVGSIVSSVVSSQLKVHRPYGGVVPEIAAREHLQNWPAVSGEALERAGLDLSAVDVVAATRGPGLVGSLLVGLSLGKAMALALERPFHAVHHMEGHLYSPFIDPEGGGAEEPPRHFFGLVVSGGHTLLLEVEDGKVSTLGFTRDDAVGEAFDKIAKRLGLPFPGGPRLDELAEDGVAEAHPMPVPSCGESLDFSYSGLKSHALLAIEGLEKSGVPIWLGEPGTAAPHPKVLDLMAGFRAAAVGQLLERVERLRRDRSLPLLAVSGGVAANRLLRRTLPAWCEERGIPLKLVPLAYSGDNAAMIAHAALLRHRRGIRDDPRSAEVSSRIPFEEGGQVAGLSAADSRR